ncbi:hypothetical protein C0J52_20674, partial [Blattella germanica]
LSPLSLPLSLKIPLFSFIIVFSIEISDHKLPGIFSILFLNRKYANIYIFSLISTSCSFNHLHNEAYANAYLCLDFFGINSSHPAFHASSISPSLLRSSKIFSIIRNKFQVKLVL